MYNKSADYINEGTTLKIFCSFLNMGRIRRDIWLLMEASFPISQHSNPIHTFLPPIRLSTANSDQIIGDWRDAQTYLSQEPNSGPSNPQESCRNHGQSLCKGTHKFRFQGRKQLKGRKKEGKEPTLDDCFLNPTLASNSSKGAAEHATMASSPGLEGPKVAIWRGTWSRRRWMDIGGGGGGRGREKKEARGSNAATVGMRFPVPLSFSPSPSPSLLSLSRGGYLRRPSVVHACISGWVGESNSDSCIGHAATPRESRDHVVGESWLFHHSHPPSRASDITHLSLDDSDPPWLIEHNTILTILPPMLIFLDWWRNNIIPTIPTLSLKNERFRPKKIIYYWFDHIAIETERANLFNTIAGVNSTRDCRISWTYLIWSLQWCGDQYMESFHTLYDGWA